MFLKLIDSLLSENEKKEDAGKPELKTALPAPPTTPQEKPAILLPRASEFFAYLKSIDKKYVFAATLAAIVIALATYSKAFVVVPVFIVLAALSRYLQLGFPFVIGIDLCLFLTVIAGLAYGPITGAIVGLGSALLGIIVKNTRNPEEKLAFYFGMVLVGYLASYIPLESTYLVGIATTIIYDAIVVFGYFYLVKKCIINAFTFTSTHLLFNMWLFSNFGPRLLELIS